MAVLFQDLRSQMAKKHDPLHPTASLATPVLSTLFPLRQLRRPPVKRISRSADTYSQVPLTEPFAYGPWMLGLASSFTEVTMVLYGTLPGVHLDTTS